MQQRKRCTAAWPFPRYDLECRHHIGKAIGEGYSSQLFSVNPLVRLTRRGRMVSPLSLTAGCISAVKLLCKARQAI